MVTDTFGKRKVRIVDAVLDYCDLTFGQYPCSPYPGVTQLSLDSITGWVVGFQAANLAVSTTAKEGGASISFDKSGVAGIYGTITNATLTAFDMSSPDYHMLWVYLPSIPAGLVEVFLAMGSSGTDYWEVQMAASQLVAGWNHMRFDYRMGANPAGYTYTKVGAPDMGAVTVMTFGVTFTSNPGVLNGIAIDWLTAHTRTTGLECYNTRGTCQDPTKYTNTTGKTYRFCEADAPIPSGLSVWPAITAISVAAGEIDPMGGLGGREQVTIELVDFAHQDEGIDKYRASRLLDNGGLFFEKLLQRNPHYVNRYLYIRTGYVDEDGFLLVAGMVSQRYVIEQIINKSGKVRIVARDLLSKVKEVQIPAASTGELVAAVGAADVTWTVKSGQGSQYGTAPFYVRVDDEIAKCTSRTTDALTVTRGGSTAWGTTAVAHAIDARVQLCKSWEAISADVVWHNLLTDIGIADAQIDLATAATEVARWVTGTVTAIISTPEDAKKLLADLAIHYGFFQWWEETGQVVKMKCVHARAPDDTAAVSVTDDNAIVFGSVDVQPETENRVTRCAIFYGVTDWSRSFASQDKERPAYTRVAGYIDANAESVSEYGDARLRGPVYAYFLGAASQAVAESMAFRMVSKYRTPPRKISCKLEDAVGAQLLLGAEVDLTTYRLVDNAGQPETRQCRVIKRKPPSKLDESWEFLFEETGFEGRWGFLAPDGTAAYDTDTIYAHYADVTGLMPNGDDPYILC